MEFAGILEDYVKESSVKYYIKYLAENDHCMIQARDQVNPASGTIFLVGHLSCKIYRKLIFEDKLALFLCSERDMNKIYENEIAIEKNKLELEEAIKMKDEEIERLKLTQAYTSTNSSQDIFSQLKYENEMLKFDIIKVQNALAESIDYSHQLYQSKLELEDKLKEYYGVDIKSLQDELNEVKDKYSKMLYEFNIANEAHSEANTVMRSKQFCSSCWDNLKDHALIPCGHLFCLSCANMIFQNNNACIACTSEVSSIMIRLNY